MLRYRPLPSLKAEWGYTLASITFDAFVKKLREAMQELDTRDMRDPRVIGESILNRDSQTSACQAADRLYLQEVPKYRGE